MSRAVALLGFIGEPAHEADARHET